MEKLQRIAIVGTSSTGKSTLGKEISSKFGLKHAELDSFYWKPGWKESEDSEFLSKVQEFVEKEKWVIDGNYRKVRPIVWSRAQAIIWLDFPLPVVMKRFFIRSLTRSLTSTKLWNGNRETLKNSIFNKNSLLFWILKTHFKHRRVYPDAFRLREYSHLKLFRLRSPDELDNFKKRWDALF